MCTFAGMYLQSLSVIRFRNCEETELQFAPRVNAFVGPNGVGKTNLLDAIYYLSMCKSYFNPSDSQLILNDGEFFTLLGTYILKEEKELIQATFKKGSRKIFKRNKKEYERLSEHIGLLPVVMISPVDSQLISEGSEERRRFMDSIISQFDPHYLHSLVQYQKAVSQRNALLRQFARTKKSDWPMLELYDEQMIRHGIPVYEKRKQFIEQFLPVFTRHYCFISGQDETVSLDYESQLEKGLFPDLLAASRTKDSMLQYSSAGVHKDDLVFTIQGRPLKKFGSQGQQKSFLVALKLSQFEIMTKVMKQKPILLLDDIYDKLDETRIGKLMQLVSQNTFGQIFITDAHPERVTSVFRNINLPLEVFEISNGTCALSATESE